MARVESAEVDRDFNDVDIESILARVERRGPLRLARKRSLYRAPEFVKRLAQEITVDEGATVCFDCKVVAFPNPTITWTKDGETLPDDTRYLAETVNNGEYSLKISDVTKKDEAAYRCRAENVEGSSSSTIYLAVKAIKKEKSKKQTNGFLPHSRTFPVIKEEVEKEEEEAEFFRIQPDSPLTSLYCGTRWKNRTWPDFLYEQAFAVNYYDDDFEAMDIDEDDVFLPGNYIHCTFPIHLHDNSDSDSEMENIIKQNLIFENRNFSPHERPVGACANERDINANTCTNSCSSQTVKQNGDVAHPMNSLRKRPCASVTREFCRHAVCTDNITQADESGSVRAILGEVPGMSIAIFVLLISGYTFMALKLSLNPGTFVCVELFVEFLILILRLLLD
ncbi:uncharacterized protein [Magallana gigas]|uniref:Ig-like domain-containing protein n=3 Tax=Magallana gigas TaxID=29159 RepID=A0A8W8N0V4_MAGGI|nr:uncharacterized protein LOC105347943 isoform X1 [Crassostrea gigas]